MSEEEFFNKMINQVSKVFDGRIATKMKNIYLRKEKQLNKQKEILDKIKEYINHYAVEDEDYSKIYNQEEKDILELLEEIE